MKMYIECEKGFYDFSGCAFERICQELNTNSLVIYANRKTDKRDFEIGAKVYFENVGWTEVAELGHDCGEYTCVFYPVNGMFTGDCPGKHFCVSDYRGDKKVVYFKKLDLATTDKPFVHPIEPELMPIGTKHDSGKIRPGLIPPETIRAIAEVLTYGAKKYAPDNWKQVDPERYIDALWRHYLAWKGGEIVDNESGINHMAHFATNAVFLLYFELDKAKKAGKQNENG